ncbi:alpha/beta hydrolase [Streptomyces sp. NRRL B-24484]|uniref:alpha/beta hydrolase n=1 Tax=Streptomyces sp. NRRL B-24484 TaxID=1463833 RepID=UPI000694E55E|nr:alpha/beta hydrolase-fold protein [Streptomyces sp. NRRL B-24484]
MEASGEERTAGAAAAVGRIPEQSRGAERPRGPGRAAPAGAPPDGGPDGAEPSAGQPETGTGRRGFLRALLVAGIGAAAVGGAMVEDVLPGGARLRRAIGMTGPDGTVPAVEPGPVRTDQLASKARGRRIELTVISPPGTAPRADLPVCLALHGRGGSAAALVDLGLPQFLAAATAKGVPPFHLVAVDGGEATYWHRRTPGDDPMAMLLDEVPGWLAARGLAAPTGVLGISMGGSGALQYARARDGGLAAAALLSPALFTSWDDARPVDAYQDEADWVAHEPLRHLDRPLTRRLAVWCGTEDPFCPAARRLADRAAETHFPRGAHTDGFWRRVLPDATAFLGQALARRT